MASRSVTSGRKGRCAVVLPQGVLFHGGEDGAIRKQLIESDKLECVITLVSGLFYSTGVSACILILNNNKPAERRGKICLIDAATIYTARRAQNIMTESDVVIARRQLVVGRRDRFLNCGLTRHPHAAHPPIRLNTTG